MQCHATVALANPLLLFVGTAAYVLHKHHLPTLHAHVGARTGKQ